MNEIGYEKLQIPEYQSKQKNKIWFGKTSFLTPALLPFLLGIYLKASPQVLDIWHKGLFIFENANVRGEFWIVWYLRGHNFHQLITVILFIRYMRLLIPTGL